MTLNEIVVYNIKRIRKAKGITQEQLAQKCNTSTSYIGLLETKKKNPQLSTIDKIAKALEIDPTLLFIAPTNADDTNNSNPQLKKQILDEIDLVLKKLI